MPDTEASTDDDERLQVDQQQAEDVPLEKDSMTLLTEQFVAATQLRNAELDWDIAEALLQRSSGVPTPVGQAIKNAATSAAFD